MVEFSRDVLDHKLVFDRFFSAEEEVEQIKAEKNLEAKGLYFGRWQVAWIVFKSPVEFCLHLLFIAVANLLYFVGMTRGYHLFSVLANQVSRDLHQLLAQWDFGEDLLVPAINAHRIDSTDLYLQPDLLVSEIESSEIRAFTDEKVLTFGNPDGSCTGGAEWFLYLYHLTESYFDNPKEHLIAIARQFEKGVPRQGALLQTLKSLKAREYLQKRKMQFYQFEQRAEALNTIPVGAHHMGGGKHAWDYFKFDEKTGYIWDSNKGLISLENRDQGKALLKYLSRYATPKDPIYLHWYDSAAKEESAV